MPADLAPDRVRRQAEAILGRTGEWRLASSTNSRVWRVTTGSGAMSVKLLTDASSDVHVERRLLRELGPGNARPILEVADMGEGEQLVVAPYLDGELVADRLQREAVPDGLGRELAGQYRTILAEVSRLPLRSPGYGRFGSGHQAEHERWSDALGAYLEEQRRKGPRTSALRHPALADALRRLADRLDAECGPPRVIPTDVNSRNFLIAEPGRKLVALNFPVIWQGDPAMPFGILQLHLDDTPMAAALAEGTWPRWRIHFYAAYHAFVICVYVERFTRVPLEEATPWGRRRPLLGLFDTHLRLMEEAL
ncbi:MAG: hypothetical protein HOY76_30295 [Streptomyces sp.]|nr:hypothetical protein [Streptomyces sp.]NUS15324.1 hypothetical protein [Streptomyces sp.]